MTLPLGCKSPRKPTNVTVVASRTVTKLRDPVRSKLNVVLIPSLPLPPAPPALFVLVIPMLVVATGAGPVGTNATPHDALLVGDCSCLHMAHASGPARPLAAAAAAAVPARREAKRHVAATLAPRTPTLDGKAVDKALGLCTEAQLKGGPRRLGRRLRKRHSAIGAGSSRCCGAIRAGITQALPAWRRMG